jgi:hypothetical protein
MCKRIAVTLAIALSASVVFAGADQQPATPEANRVERPGPAPVNVRVEISITDQGAAQPAKKTVALVVADGANGYIRSQGNEGLRINVDARPNVAPSGNAVRLQFGIEYNPQQANPPGQAGSSLSQQMAVHLESGKPMQISQSADPLSDRRVGIEVKATILK